MMADLAELLKIIAIPLTLLFAASGVLQALERGRRELAVNLVYNWARDTDWATTRAVDLARELDDSNIIKDINRKGNVSIPKAHYDAVMSILREKFPEAQCPDRPSDSETAFNITAEHSRYIHFLWARWLNRLEGTLAAWQQSAADPELMEREFAPLVKGSEAELEVLAVVRDGLPVIQEFYTEQKTTGRIRQRRRLGIFPWPR
jgi:hypothetical protein